MPPLAKALAQQSAEPRCTSTPCGNTSSGEDPQELRIRRGRQMSDAVVAGTSDEERWTVPLFSDSKNPKDLELDLIESAGFRLRLHPARGQIEFMKGGANDLFEIGLPAAPTNLFCRKYFIMVLNASPTHAMIEKSCQESEYKPGRFHSSTSYFLYDSITHSMRSVWESSASVKGAPAPAIDTQPMVSVLPNGYELRWKGSYVRDGKTKTVSLHNRYTQKAIDEGMTALICRDLLHPDAGPETGGCEGSVLSLVSSSGRKK